MNLEGAIRLAISKNIAKYFYLMDSTLFDVPVISLITILNGFVVNAWGRFVEPMDKLNYLNPTKLNKSPDQVNEQPIRDYRLNHLQKRNNRMVKMFLCFSQANQIHLKI